MRTAALQSRRTCQDVLSRCSFFCFALAGSGGPAALSTATHLCRLPVLHLRHHLGKLEGRDVDTSSGACRERLALARRLRRRRLGGCSGRVAGAGAACGPVGARAVLAGASARGRAGAARGRVAPAWRRTPTAATIPAIVPAARPRPGPPALTPAAAPAARAPRRRAPPPIAMAARAAARAAAAGAARATAAGAARAAAAGAPAQQQERTSDST